MPGFNAGSRLTAAAANLADYQAAAMTVSGVSNSTTETVVGSVTVPATDPGLSSTGCGYRLYWFGVASCTGTPTLQIQIREASVTGTIIANFGAITCQSGGSGMHVAIDMELLISSTGPSGTFDCMTTLRSSLAAATVAFGGSGSNAKPINTTAAFTLVVTALWGTASASNTLTGDVGTLDRI